MPARDTVYVGKGLGITLNIDFLFRLKRNDVVYTAAARSAAPKERLPQQLKQQ
jgi:hypothetical protein